MALISFHALNVFINPHVKIVILTERNTIYCSKQGICNRFWIIIKHSKTGKNNCSYVWIPYSSTGMLSQGRRQNTWTNAWGKLSCLVSKRRSAWRAVRLVALTGYTSEERAKIGRYAAENGPASATRHFAVSETTARKLKCEYLQRRWRQCSMLRTRPSWWSKVAVHEASSLCRAGTAILWRHQSWDQNLPNAFHGKSAKFYARQYFRYTVCGCTWAYTNIYRYMGDSK